MHRKYFIKTCGLICIGGAALSALLESCSSSLYYAQYKISENKLTVKKSEFTEIKSEKIKQRKFVLLKTEKLAFPVCIFKHNENLFTALYMECTHRGCELKTNGSFIVCPCHGSEFTNAGVVQNPPADKNLKQFLTTIDDENIYILL